jgi:outer membrane protein OmpA-like peptidoglycan-associated protein
VAALALLLAACGGGGADDRGAAQAASPRDATTTTTTTVATTTSTTAAATTTTPAAACADQCLDEIEVEASDDGRITVSGPQGEVSMSTDEAVGALGGEVTTRGIEVALPDSVLFDFGSAALRTESSQQLSLIAGLAAAFPEAPLTVGGHADAIGNDADNQLLSEARAAVVAQALQTLGVDADRMTATGFGESRPVAPDTNPDGSDNPEGRRLNRRVEVLVVGARD